MIFLYESCKKIAFIIVFETCLNLYNYNIEMITILFEKFYLNFSIENQT